MKWKYNRKSKQDESDTKEMGVYRQTYIIGRHEGLFRLVRQDWKAKPFKFIAHHGIGDFSKLKIAKAVAEMLNETGWLPIKVITVDKKAIKLHLQAALDALVDAE